MDEGEPFARRLRRRSRCRAAGLVGGHDFLLRHVARELAEREAGLLPLPEGPILHLGALAPVWPGARPAVVADACRLLLGQREMAVQCEEDRLPFRDEAFALVRSVLVLHGVNDVPGALLLVRRALKPGGRLIGAMLGGEALAEVRRAFVAADLATGGAVAVRVGPSVDPAAVPGLLQRTGFADPVVDVERVTARYRTLADLARDARGMGETGWLAARERRITTRARWAAAERAFAEQREADGRVPVSVHVIYLSARRA